MYTIGQVCALFDIKPHVLRYWETEIPLLSPRKDAYGRRMYTSADLQLIARIKYLAYEKRFTLEGIRKTLEHELDAPPLLMQIRMARSILLRTLSVIRKDIESIEEFADTDTENQDKL
ncbi:MerR family transcriptional regulator [Spirochaetia bacterium 38H-sp]|uniref:MerR family transcriptional regulator n=1 Tax=Rarispira pelagica TaxID=3141764 RepID=A0ABU9UBA0_9SPIR